MGARVPVLAAMSGVVFVVLTCAATAGEAPNRYALDAESRPLQVSACGRFALEASARYVPKTESVDGRYTLESVRVPTGGCDPQPDPLFANGFEAP